MKAGEGQKARPKWYHSEALETFSRAREYRLEISSLSVLLASPSTLGENANREFVLQSRWHFAIHLY